MASQPARYQDPETEAAVKIKPFLIFTPFAFFTVAKCLVWKRPMAYSAPSCAHDTVWKEVGLIRVGWSRLKTPHALGVHRRYHLNLIRPLFRTVHMSVLLLCLLGWDKSPVLPFSWYIGLVTFNFQQVPTSLQPGRRFYQAAVWVCRVFKHYIKRKYWTCEGCFKSKEQLLLEGNIIS